MEPANHVCRRPRMVQPGQLQTAGKRGSRVQVPHMSKACRHTRHSPGYGSLGTLLNRRPTRFSYLRIFCIVAFELIQSHTSPLLWLRTAVSMLVSLWSAPAHTISTALAEILRPSENRSEVGSFASCGTTIQLPDFVVGLT